MCCKSPQLCYNRVATASGFRFLNEVVHTNLYFCVRYAPVQNPLRCGGKSEALDRRIAFKDMRQ